MKRIILKSYPLWFAPTKLLRLMKNNVGACETVNIADCVRRAIEFTDAESKAELNVDFGCGDIAVWGVSGYITEVFVNIIMNAVDATRDTGRKPAIGISVISENDCCMVEVSDNGSADKGTFVCKKLRFVDIGG